MKVRDLNIIIVLIYIFFGAIDSKLFPIEIKYPLLNPITDIPKVPLWPMPSFVNDTSKGFLFLKNDSFKITSNFKCDIIDQNIAHYTKILFPSRVSFNAPSSGQELATELNIEVSTQTCPRYPDESMDESYELSVGKVSKLKANSVWGVLRGLETFTQLTDITEDQKLTLRDSIVVKDTPRFKYRGLLLDTARHYIPVPILRKQLDALSYSKFNVLHWHIVDDQSFPLEIRFNTNVTKFGRYSAAHVYTRDDIKTIIEHARLRGIRIIPEFDSPGHVDALGRTFPQFITVCWHDNKPYQAIYSVQGEAEIFNPTLEALYPMVKEILNEIKQVFVDDYIHLGMDEVYYECWKSNPNIIKWMRNMNFTDYHQLEGYYSKNVLDMVKDLNKKAVVWQDVYDNGVKLDKETYIEIWRDTNTISTDRKWYEYLNDITRDGYKAILSSPWYINFVSYGYHEWFNWYQIEPMMNFTGNAEQEKLLIGGEACLWAEYVDGSNIDSRLWPRASVIAERLWSPRNVNNPEEAKFRLDEHRCRLLRRGIAAAPVLNGYCGNYEYGMANSVIFDPEFNYGWPNIVPSKNSSPAANILTVWILIPFAFIKLLEVTLFN